jgi:hypothetical protein
MAMKKERLKVEIDMETGDVKLDVLNGVGSSCSKEAADIIDALGSAKSGGKKPEYFRKVVDKAQNVLKR